MFDLFRSRDKAVRIMLGVILGVVALSMLLYLVPGAGSSTGTANDNVIAEIGPDTVTTNDIDQQIKNVLQGRQLPPEMLQVYIPQLVEQAISDRAVAYQASQLGFEMSDADLANTIRSLGQFATMTPQQYRDYVEQQIGQTVPEFERNVRLRTYQSSLENMAQEGVIVTPKEVEAEYKKNNEKIKLEYVAFDPVKLAKDVKPTAEDLKSYYDRNKGFFTTPETRAVQLIIADQAKVAETIQVSETQLQAYYNSHVDQFRVPERVKARHILIATSGKSKDEVAKLKTKAEDILKQLKAGGDFAALAKKNSDDTSNAPQGGDLGWVVRGQMVKEFEDATFALKAKELSGIVTTQYGFHIVQALEREPAHLRTLDEARPEILTAVRNQSVFDKMQALTDQAHTELVKAPQNAQQIAAQLNLQYVSLDHFKQGDPIAELPGDASAAGNILALKKGEVSAVMQAGTKLAIAEVTNIMPPHPSEFAEVQEAIRTRYQQEKSVQFTAEKSKKAAEMLRSNGGDLKAVAKSFGVEVKTSDFFTRTGSVSELGSGNYFADSFDKPVGTIVGPVNVGAATVAGKILDRQAADMAKLVTDRDTIVTQIKGKKAGERQILLQDSILNSLMQRGKVKIHRDVENRLIARYRS